MSPTVVYLTKLLLVLFCQYELATQTAASSWSSRRNHGETPDLPIFEGSQATNVTAHFGSSAHLSCKVRNNKKENPVSWFRQRDWHILSSGEHTFTQDARFSVRHIPASYDWTLIIKFTNKRDEGVYVCQVSSSNGVHSHHYNLHVVVPKAYILGTDEYYAQAGNAISLVCIIEDTLEPPQYVYWYHNGQLINYDTERTRVSFDLGEKTNSRLVIANVQTTDSGNYTCSTTHAQPSQIRVYVSDGEEAQPVHDNGGNDLFRVATKILIVFQTIYFLTNK